MCNAAEHAFKEKSTKLLILLPLRTIYNRTFQCETPCIVSSNKILIFRQILVAASEYMNFTVPPLKK